MNRYQHVSSVTSAVHDEFVSWTRGILQEAGLETVEVYGQFPPQGTVSSHLVLFPYRLGPEPRIMDNSKGLSLLRPRVDPNEHIQFIPLEWVELGRLLASALNRFFPGFDSVRMGAMARAGYAAPLAVDLPDPLRNWYEDRESEDLEDPWIEERNGKKTVRIPAIWWQPGYHLTMRYIAVAGEPGRGTQAERTSTSAPLSLSALTVMATGVQLDRVIYVRVPPLPYNENLKSYILAVADSLDGSPESERMRELIQILGDYSMVEVALTPVHDLSNHEFALIMQALQRPLQAALNLQIRLKLAAYPVFAPGVQIAMVLAPPRPRASSRLHTLPGARS